MATTVMERVTQAVRRAGQHLPRLRPEQREPVQVEPMETNIGSGERLASEALGATMALAGLAVIVRRPKLSLLGLATAATGGLLAWRGAAGHCPAYSALGITREDATAASHPLSRLVHVDREITINRPADQLYGFCRNLANLPNILSGIESVEELDNSHSHWVAMCPVRGRIEWDARLTEDQQDEVIAWASVPQSKMTNIGRIELSRAGADRGTRVYISLLLQPPAGAIGAAVGKLMGVDLRAELGEGLRRFKQIVETGEIATTAGQPRGRCRR